MGKKRRRQVSPVYTLLIFALLLAITAVLFWMISEETRREKALQPPPAPPLVTPTPTPEVGKVETWYKVYFTAPGSEPIDKGLEEFIKSARYSVDMAIYQLDLPAIVQALLEVSQRGVKVRVVTDIDDVLKHPEESKAFLELERHGIPVVGGNTSGIMHNKFVIVDGRAVWTGSWNFTVNDTNRYDNNAILIYSPELARNYQVTFNKMFEEKKFGPGREAGGTTPHLVVNGVPVENYFAPEDGVGAKIAEKLEKATSSVYFMAFSFTDDRMGKALRERAREGVLVRGVFETTGSQTKYSEFGALLKAGIDVRQDGNPYLMHHKVFIIDEKIVITGSFNFSASADESNDENVVIIEDPTIAKAFLTEFQRVYSAAKK